MKSYMSWTLLLLAFLSLGQNETVVSGQVVFTVTERPDNTTDPDPTPWLATVRNVTLFETEAENIMLASEVDLLPGLNENGLGRETGTLTFNGEETLLGWSFSITADATTGFPGNAATGFTYNDTEGGDIFRTGALSPGDVSNFEDDDVTFRFFGGEAIHGFGFDLLDSNVSLGESLLVYDQADLLLASFDLPPGPDGRINNFFLGVSSTEPIGRITFLENDGSDDIAIRDFRFATAIAIPELLGDVNLDGAVDFLDIAPFISILSGADYQAEADINEDGDVNFLDISPFIALLSS